MDSYQEKIARHPKRQKTQFEETHQSSEIEMAGMLEWSDQFKTTVINMLRALMAKVGNMQERMANNDIQNC